MGRSTALDIEMFMNGRSTRYRRFLATVLPAAVVHLYTREEIAYWWYALTPAGPICAGLWEGEHASSQ